MAKKSGIDRAIADVETEISGLTRVLERLLLAKQSTLGENFAPKPRKPRTKRKAAGLPQTGDV